MQQRPRVALVSKDPDTRFRAARVFDDAPRDWIVGLFEAPPADADVVVVAPDVDISGIPLDLRNPERTLFDIAQRLDRPRVESTIVVVAGAGGGVGCTSVALHLAAFLSVDEPALYVEGTATCGGRYRLALDRKGPDWSDVGDADSIDRAALPIHAGFRALLAPEGIACVPSDVLAWCSERSGFVVVDAGRASDVSVNDNLVPLMVFSPTVPCARRSAELAAKAEIGPVLISNRIGPGSEATDKMLEDVLGRRISVTLPCSPALRDAEDEGRVLGRDASTWSRRVARLADRLRT